MEGPDEIARKKLEHFSEWLKSYKEMTEVLPYVQRARDYAEWEVEVIESLPSKVTPLPDLSYTLQAEFQIAKERFPVFTPYQSVDISASGTATGISGSALLDVINQASFIPETAEWSASSQKSYAELSDKYGQEGNVRSLLQRLNPKLAEEFDFLAKNIASPSSGFERSQNSANSMRNVLTHYKGDLWDQARRPEEQKAQWKLIADRLCKFPEDSPEFKLLLCQEEVWKDLHTDLSNLTKNTKIDISPPTNIDLYYAKFKDHLQQVLSLVSY